MTQPQPCFVLRYNHFDPIWRRCWDRDFFDAGRRFVSYRAIEEHWITDALATCEDGGSCFMLESAWVLRHYLEKHPEHQETFKKLTREGRFELLGSGENIIDVNMVHGEMLVRNLALGTWWAEQTLGKRPSTGWHSDGFGSCAQMPQVFRQCGYDWLPAISYNTPDAPYWRGLDGTTIFFSCDKLPASYGPQGRLPHRNGLAGTPYQKCPPCPACDGVGCDACQGEGFTIASRADFAPTNHQSFPGEVGVYMLWGEEIMPGLHVPEDIAHFNAAHPHMHVRQGIYEDLRTYITEPLAHLGNPPAELVSTKVENNPSQSGCYVSRIRMKQEYRQLEHALLAAECWDALLTAGEASTRLRDAWRQMTLVAFHDAITSSHCDPAYTELLELNRAIGNVASDVVTQACARALDSQPATATIFNHHGFPASAPVTLEVPGTTTGASVTTDDGTELPVYRVIPGEERSTLTFLTPEIPTLGARTVAITPGAVPVLPMDGPEVASGIFTVHAGEHGITQVSSQDFGPVTDTQDYLFGEMLLEHDMGDPWATRSLDRTRERLSPYTHLQGIERQGSCTRIRYAGQHPATENPHQNCDPHVTHLTWEQTYCLYDGIPWLTLETRVEWYTQSRRLRMAFPSNTTMNRGVYEVPYGVLERERYEGTSTDGGNAGGDWPALHWAGIQTEDYTFAVMNQGTPSYRVEDGVVLVSVLRSPQIPYGLLEPSSYVAYNYDGMRDHGSHCFRHALYLGKGDWHDNDTVRQAALFNSGLLALQGVLAKPLPAWEINATHVDLTATKRAEDGRGIILRLVETAGRTETVTVRVPETFHRAFLCNLLEDDLSEIQRSNGVFSIQLDPWKIATVRLTDGS